MHGNAEIARNNQRKNPQKIKFKVNYSLSFRTHFIRAGIYEIKFHRKRSNQIRTKPYHTGFFNQVDP